MNIHIIFTLMLLSSLSLMSNIWERVDGPYDFPFFIETAIYNNELYCFSGRDEIFKLEHNVWKKENLQLPTNDRITFFKQKENITIFSTNMNSCYISTDYGMNWLKTPDIESNGEGSVFVQDFEIIGDKLFIIKPHASVPKRRIFEYNFSNNSWHRVKVEDSNLEVVGKTFVTHENYIVTSYPYLNYTDSLISGTFYSTDYGDTWYRSDSLKHSFSTMIIHNKIIFATSLDSLLYKSYDFGKTWETNQNTKFPAYLYYSDNENLYAALSNGSSQFEHGLYKSTNNGESWEYIENELLNTEIRKLFKYEDKLYFLDYYKELYESNDSGKKWVQSEIYSDSIFSYDLYLNQDTLLVGTSGTRGIYYSTEEGTNWEVLGGEKDYRFSRVYKINKKDSVYVCINLGDYSLTISHDYGNTWESVLIGIYNLNYNFIKGTAILGGDTIFVSTIFGVRISTDFGKSWVEYSDEVLDIEYEYRNLLRIDDNTLILVAYNEGLFKSTDNGQSWKRIETDFLTVQSTKFETFKYYNGKIYAILPNHGVFFSEDEGLHWDELDTLISEQCKDNGLLYYNGNVIVTAENGLLIYNEFNKNVNYVEIEEFKQDTSIKTYINDIEIQNNYLILSSSIGVWRTKLIDIGITPTSVETDRNYLNTLPPYPLPARSEVKVQFYWDINLPMTVDDVSIYDLSGREVQTKDKLRINKQANYYGNLTWDCSKAQAGIYIINISHGTEERAVKVVVE